MGYFDGVMAKETGHESMTERRVAFKRMLDEVLNEMDANLDVRKRITVNAAQFISNSAERFSEDVIDPDEIKITAKQYFYMKDIYDQVMEVE